MIRLRVFGSLDLASDGEGDVGLVLRQPKRAALLAYLAAARPRGFQRRDLLIALFWPDLDTSHARDSLNAALKILRQGLGPGAVLSRGDEEVGISADRIWTDVVAFETSLVEAKHEEALALYRGDLLEGFHVAEAAGFEEWMERERQQLRGAAAQAARALADRKVAAGDLGLAVHWARRSVALLPDDESALRHLLELLDAAGDHAGALRVFGEFASRLKQEFGAEPATETKAVMARIRHELRGGDSSSNWKSA